MEESEGSCKKRRKKMVDVVHYGSVLLSKVQNQVECSIAAKGPLQTHEAAAAEDASSHHNMCNDEEEKEESSFKDQALINVEGYCVKKEVAPMLQRIFDKYKDVTRDCKINDRTILVPVLEMICSFCQKLVNVSLNITDTELEDMILIVENFQLMGLDVKWLSERLKRLLKDSLALKEDITKIMIKEEDVGILKQKLSTAEAELEMIKAENYKARRKFEQQRMDLNLDGFLHDDRADVYSVLPGEGPSGRSHKEVGGRTEEGGQAEAQSDNATLSNAQAKSDLQVVNNKIGELEKALK